jgi:hypothetical protein
MSAFRLPISTVHLAGSPKQQHMDVWFLSPGHGEELLIITE